MCSCMISKTISDKVVYKMKYIYLILKEALTLLPKKNRTKSYLPGVKI